jgi:Ca-activated chloride channel family protein
VNENLLLVHLCSYLVLIAAVTLPVKAESVIQINNEGNKLYQQGQYKDAIDQYDKALTQSPQEILPRFNKADSYYRLDDLPQAIDLYRAVAAESKDMQLVAKAKYNLGDCFFRQGTMLKDSDLQKAVENMQSAIGWWRQALDIDPANENAAKNIEVARLTIKDIIDQINKQKQQQQQQKQNQEDLKKLLEQQKTLADKTQQEKQKPNPDYNDISKEQNQLKDKTEQVKQQLQQQNDPNQPNEQNQKAAEQLDKATDKQKDASEKLDKSDADNAKKSQDEAAKNIEDALKQLSEQKEQQQQQQQNQQQQQQAQPEPNQPAEPNQAQQQQEQETAPDAAAEEILDREQRQKDQRQLMQSPGFPNVDKDW